MSTDLFVVASGFDASAVVARVPPACRRAIDPAPVPGGDGSDILLESPAWVPRPAAVHFVPSFSSLARADIGFRLEVSVRDGDGWCPWVAGAPVGPAGLRPLAPEAPGRARLACDVDVFTTPARIHEVRARVRLPAAAAHALAAPWLLTLSAWDRCAAPSGAWAGAAIALDVPASSQMDAPAAIARRICSPTSVAMVLGYWGGTADPAGVAADAFDPALDRYGVWPAAIHAAARRGLSGYLLAFPDWASAAWCLEQGLPVIASIRYTAGELPGAAMVETDGHLVVLTGYDGSHVLVNDPAAPRREGVPRRLRVEALERVWLARAAVGYVLFRPA